MRFAGLGAEPAQRRAAPRGDKIFRPPTCAKLIFNRYRSAHTPPALATWTPRTINSLGENNNNNKNNKIAKNEGGRSLGLKRVGLDDGSARAD